jgi:hypothetical protein
MGVGMVYVRRCRTQIRHDVQTLQSNRIAVERQLQDQQVRLGWLVAPAELRRKAREEGLGLVGGRNMREDSSDRTARLTD